LVVLGLLALGAVTGFADSDTSGAGLALLALAGVPVVFAVPPRGRPVVGAAFAVVALLVAVTTWPPEPLTGVAVATVVGAGLVMVVRGRSWPAMARRFDTGGSGPVDLWRELDRGRDPTDRPPDAPSP
jgi:hypothetical protein